MKEEVKQEEMNILAQDTYEEDPYQMKPAPLVQDVRDPAMTAHYDSEDLDGVFNEMKTMFNNCDFESRKNPTEEDGGITLNSVCLPVSPSLPGNIDGIRTETQILFHNYIYEMKAQYEGSFSIKNAVIRAKFVGDENCHCFYIGEHDMLSAHLYIGRTNTGDNETTKAFLVDMTAEQPVVGELEEFAILATTRGFYHKKYMKPKALNEDLVLFTCFDKTRKLSCDTVASFKNGLCDPETIFTDDGTEDVPADWAVGNLPK